MPSKSVLSEEVNNLDPDSVFELERSYNSSYNSTSTHLLTTSPVVEKSEEDKFLEKTREIIAKEELQRRERRKFKLKFLGKLGSYFSLALLIGGMATQMWIVAGLSGIGLIGFSYIHEKGE